MAQNRLRHFFSRRWSRSVCSGSGEWAVTESESDALSNSSPLRKDSGVSSCQRFRCAPRLSPYLLPWKAPQEIQEMDARGGLRSQAHRRVSPKHQYSSSSDGLLVPPESSTARISAGSSLSSLSGKASKSSSVSSSFGIARDVARGNVGLAYGPYSVSSPCAAVEFR